MPANRKATATIAPTMAASETSPPTELFKVILWASPAERLHDEATGQKQTYLNTGCEYKINVIRREVPAATAAPTAKSTLVKTKIRLGEFCL